MIHIAELPREAFQSHPVTISTAEKVRYLNLLLKVGFNTVETGSLVSPRLIPQLADSLDVLELLDMNACRSRIMMLVVNQKGAEWAAERDRIDCLSYPFGISRTFQQKNLNTTLEASEKTVAFIQNLCMKQNKDFVLYLSMAFGNPYGDAWNEDILFHWVERFHQMGLTQIQLSNVSVMVTPGVLSHTFRSMQHAFPDLTLGLHLHSRPQKVEEKIQAVLDAGCRYFDTVITGLGGCPMTEHELLGNLGTESLLAVTSERGIKTGLDMAVFQEATLMSSQLFQ